MAEEEGTACGSTLSDVSRAVNKENDKATYPISRRREHSGGTASISWPEVRIAYADVAPFRQQQQCAGVGELGR